MTDEPSWRDYERKTKELFEGMGFAATTQETLVGARGKHNIDVVARKTLGGVAITWIVECKFWKSSIQKAQVLTLMQIAQDVGADRAFLMSESGFQAGAIAATKSTNVSLTSIAELMVAADEVIAETSIKSSLSKVKTIEQKLQHLLGRQQFHIPPPTLFDQTVDLLGACFEVTLITSDVLAGKLPVRLPSFLADSEPAFTSDVSFIATALQKTIEELVRKTDGLELALSMRRKELRPALDALMEAVDQLLLLGDSLARDIPHPDEDEKLKVAVRIMRTISSHADALREISTGGLQYAVRALMRELIDGTYLWLGDPSRSMAVWANIKRNTRDKINKMIEAGQKPSENPE